MDRLQAILPPTLYLIIREKLLNLLMGNLTPEQRAAISSNTVSS
jgi:hypothetical protein